MSRPVRGVLLDTVNNTIREHTMNGTLEDIYDALNCRCFDIAERKIAGEYFSVYCDDEGLLNQAPIVSAMSKTEGPMLVGSLFICRHDEEGDTVSLTDSEIKRVLGQSFHLLFPDMKIRPLLWMEY